MSSSSTKKIGMTAHSYLWILLRNPPKKTAGVSSDFLRPARARCLALCFDCACALEALDMPKLYGKQEVPAGSGTTEGHAAILALSVTISLIYFQRVWRNPLQHILWLNAQLDATNPLRHLPFVTCNHQLDTLAFHISCAAAAGPTLRRLGYMPYGIANRPGQYYVSLGSAFHEPRMLDHVVESLAQNWSHIKLSLGRFFFV